MENLLLAYKNALHSRKNTSEVYLFNQHLETNLLSLLADLQNRTYQHGVYSFFTIYESKKRYLSSPTFRDHILHHMLYNVCYPLLDKRMVYQSFATRRGKGLHQGLQYLTKKIRAQLSNSSDLWYLKVDISKYFYSISHHLLKQKLRKYIQNADLLYAMDLVIESYQTSSIFDELFPIESAYRQNKAKGLPIGTLYSQLFANFFLSDVDWFIVQILKPKIYVRYMDDFVFLDTKERLLEIRAAVTERIDKEALVIVPKKTQINSLLHGLPFLGFKLVAGEQKLQVFLSAANKRKFWKSVDERKQISCISSFRLSDKKRMDAVISSRKGLFNHAGNAKVYLEYFSA